MPRINIKYVAEVIQLSEIDAEVPDSYIVDGEVDMDRVREDENLMGRLFDTAENVDEEALEWDMRLI